MYLPTKAYYELDYQRPLLVLSIPKMLTLLGLMKINQNGLGIAQTVMTKIKTAPSLKIKW
jgi:hypothetical protein